MDPTDIVTDPVEVLREVPGFLSQLEAQWPWLVVLLAAGPFLYFPVCALLRAWRHGR